MSPAAAAAPVPRRAAAPRLPHAARMAAATIAPRAPRSQLSRLGWSQCSRSPAAQVTMSRRGTVFAALLLSLALSRAQDRYLPLDLSCCERRRTLRRPSSGACHPPAAAATPGAPPRSAVRVAAATRCQWPPHPAAAASRWAAMARPPASGMCTHQVRSRERGAAHAWRPLRGN